MVIKIGLIGFGFMGKTHYQNIQKNPNAKVSAIFTTPPPEDPPENIDIYSDDWKKVIDIDDIDAVVVATPTNTHKEIVVYAADKGKHVFVEKPMGRTLADCNEMIEAAERNNIKLFVGHVLRFWPTYLQAYNAVVNNKDTSIGSIKQIRAQRFSAFPGWSKWFADEKLSGGCILDLSIHDIDFSRWIINKNVKTVYCQAQKMKDIGIDNWGISMTTIEFEDGEIAHCEASWRATDSYGFATSCEIIGTDGIIRFDSRVPRPIEIFSKKQSNVMDPIEKDGYYLEMESFISSIINDTKTLVSGEEGRESVKICLAAIESAKLNKPINISEFKEVF